MDDLKERIEDYDALNSVLQDIFLSLQVDRTVARILTAALQLSKADQGVILLLDDLQHRGGNTLIREGSQSEEVLDHYLNRLMGGWTYTQRQTMRTNNLQQLFDEDAIPEKYSEITSAMCIPLSVEERLIGVINLISLRPQHLFQDRHERLICMLANQCARFIENAKQHEQLSEENERLKKIVAHRYDSHGIIGSGDNMRKVFALLDRMIPTDVRVLLAGESGTGKELVAKVIHYNGPRKNGPFIAVDCGALPANLLESELFGYVKGAFTGADKDRKGLFEEASDGTLFLDEVGNTPLEVQSKLLRAIQEGEIRPLGTNKSRKIDVRIIAAANQNLKEKAQSGEFRQDLFYRLNVVHVELPPLRNRKEDIAILSNHFLNDMNTRYNKSVKGFTDEAMNILESYSWPGNVRELEHAIEQAVVLSNKEYLDQKDFSFLKSPSAIKEELFKPRPLQDAVHDFKKHYIDRLLEHTDGNQSKAARILKIQRTYLSRLLKELRIKSQ
jgi:Nif-specific regulatory protein